MTLSKVKIDQNFIINTVLISILLLGVYLCFIGGYGSDEDTLPMIYVFEAKISDGRFVSSRFTGNPVAELGIGFLAYFFGSWAANLFTYFFLLLGVIFFYLTLTEKKNLKDINIFLLLCLTNPILFFDNLEPIDYSWALIFFSIGLYFLNKKLFEISVICFAFSIGVRINYVLFVLVSIMFFDFKFAISNFRRVSLFISSFIIGGLFYIPIWFDNKFDLKWLTAARPTEQGILGILTRFFYKSYVAVGFISFFILVYYFFKHHKKITKIKNFKFLIILGLSNLLIFLWIPAEYSYLQLFLVILNFIIFNMNNKKLIYIICVANLLSWVFFISPIKVDHQKKERCAPKNALSAKIEFTVEQGFYFKYLSSRDKIKCWVHGNSERSLKILQGKALK
jgi:hypothetical protein